MLLTKYVKPIAVVSFLLAVLLFATACEASFGSILIKEKANGKEINISFNGWKSQDSCKITADVGDTLQFEVVHKNGEIDITVKGENGSVPYEGKDVQSGIFTVTVSEAGTYKIIIKGKSADGKIKIKNVG